MEKELCVRCGNPTPYDISTPITGRRWYAEGAGQLCEACYSRLYRLPAAFLSDCESKTDGKKEVKEEMQFTWFNKDGRKRTVNLSSISDIEQYEEDGHYCLRAKNAFFGGNFAAFKKSESRDKAYTDIKESIEAEVEKLVFHPSFYER